MSDSKITIYADIAADKDAVWNKYTEPEHITKWNFASEDWHCPTAENDLRPGGTYKARMEAKDGSFGFDFEAVYDMIEPGKQYRYTMPDGREVTTAFETTGDKVTRLTITFDPENQNSIDMQRDGWQAILNNFKQYVEG